MCSTNKQEIVAKIFTDGVFLESIIQQFDLDLRKDTPDKQRNTRKCNISSKHTALKKLILRKNCTHVAMGQKTFQWNKDDLL